MTVYAGACHCGAVKVEFETTLDPKTIDVRACQCGHCRRQGSKTVSDPKGMLTLYAAPNTLSRYQFATGTLDIVSCSHCMTYMVATMSVNGALRAALNVVGAGMEIFAEREARPITYDEAQTAQQRIAARTIHWMPIAIHDVSEAAAMRKL